MTNPAINEFGTKRWHNEKEQPHRIDGPAIECVDGHREWWAEGRLHRIDGPAIEFVNGDKSWYCEGELHRLDGPAMEWFPDTCQWWIRGKHLRFVPKMIVFSNDES